MVREDYDRLQEYKQAHLNKHKICQQLKISLETLKRIWSMSESEFDYYIACQGSIIESYREFILDILETTPTITNLNIYYKILEAFPETNFSESNFQKYMKKLRAETGYDRFTKFRTSIRANPVPGEETQVDFGEYWIKDVYGKKRKLFFMVMVLRYSQLKFVYFQTQPFTSLTAIQAHIEGFKFFGGMTKILVYDQDSVFCTNENYGNIILEKDFEAFLKQYHINFVFCGPYHPQSKGTVENQVKLVKRHFLDGRVYHGIDSLNSACLEWLDNVENNHFLIEKKVTPQALFKKEAPKLIKLKLGDYINRQVFSYKVRNNTVWYRYAFYEVPAGYIGKTVDVETDGINLIIRDQETKVVLAVHRYTTERGARVKIASDNLPPAATEVYVRNHFRKNKIATDFLDRFKEDEERYFVKGCLKIKTLIKIYSDIELEDGFQYCLDNKRFNITILGSYLLMKYGDEKGKKAFGKNYYYYKEHIKDLKQEKDDKK